jgi:hypothetical protein
MIKRIVNKIKEDYREFITARKRIEELEIQNSNLDKQKSIFEKICCNNTENYYLFYKLTSEEFFRQKSK